jgi:acetyltransferase-like isoleucine patch superfamily enzyme
MNIIGKIVQEIKYKYHHIEFEKRKYIKLSDNVTIKDYTLLSGYKGGKLIIAPHVMICRFCKIMTCGGVIDIKSNVQIGEYCTITGQGNVLIEENVLMADNIKIIANQHNYDRIDISIKKQGCHHKEIIIRSGSWIGINVTILSGVTIGRNSVIGAGSVVTKDVPDYSVAVGNPAKVIKHYDIVRQKWVNEIGSSQKVDKPINIE